MDSNTINAELPLISASSPVATDAAQSNAHSPSVVVAQSGAIDWIGLALSLREPEIEILRLVYLPQPKTWLFLDVYNRLERLHYSERTARRKIAFLAAKNLVSRQYSGIGLVIPIEQHGITIQRMLAFLDKRRQPPEFGQGITGELLRLLEEDKRREECR
jgi:hypothetical protein